MATIWRHLEAAGLITPEPKKRPKTSYIRFQADLPNETWQSDFTHWHLVQGQDVEIVTFLDDHSRYALLVTAHRRIATDIVDLRGYPRVRRGAECLRRCGRRPPVGAAFCRTLGRHGCCDARLVRRRASDWSRDHPVLAGKDAQSGSLSHTDGVLDDLVERWEAWCPQDGSASWETVLRLSMAYRCFDLRRGALDEGGGCAGPGELRDKRPSSRHRADFRCAGCCLAPIPVGSSRTLLLRVLIRIPGLSGRVYP